MKNVFVLVNEKLAFKTMLKVAAHLGRKRIYRKDFERFGIIEMSEEEADSFINSSEEIEPKPDSEPEKVEETNDEADSVETLNEPIIEPEIEDTSDETDDKRNLDEPEPENSEPERVNDVTLNLENIDDFAYQCKRLAQSDIIALAEKYDLEWSRNSNSGIDRMRAQEALDKHFFPGQKRTRRKKTSWSKVPLPVLEKLAEEKGLTYQKTQNDKITRMWVTKALKNANVEVPENARLKELKKETGVT